MSLSAMESRLSVANTAFIALELAASAWAAVLPWVTTPVENCAWSGAALAMPCPDMVTVRGAGSAPAAHAVPTPKTIIEKTTQTAKLRSSKLMATPSA